MKIVPFLVTLALSTCNTLFAADLPEGYYQGTVTIYKSIFPEFLGSRQTLKAQGVVERDGKITLLTSVPESPAAAMNTESAVTRVVPIPPPVQSPIPEDPRKPYIYAYKVDGKYGGSAYIFGKDLIVQYQTLQQTDDSPYQLELESNTRIVFKLLKVDPKKSK